MKIKLGREYKEDYYLATPEKADSSKKKKGSSKKIIHYPSLYISSNDMMGSDDGSNTLKGVPEKGTAVVEFTTRTKEIRTDNNGEKRCSIELDITSIDFKSSPQPEEKKSDDDWIEEGLSDAESKGKEKQ